MSLSEKDIELALMRMIQSEQFKQIVATYTKKTCADMLRTVRYVTGPLVLLVCALLGYIFVTLSGSVTDLAITTRRIDRTLAQFQERTETNRLAIQRLSKAQDLSFQQIP